MFIFYRSFIVNSIVSSSENISESIAIFYTKQEYKYTHTYIDIDATHVSRVSLSTIENIHYFQHHHLSKSFYAHHIGLDWRLEN